MLAYFFPFQTPGFSGDRSLQPLGHSRLSAQMLNISPHFLQVFLSFPSSPKSQPWSQLLFLRFLSFSLTPELFLSVCTPFLLPFLLYQTTSCLVRSPAGPADHAGRKSKRWQNSGRHEQALAEPECPHS